MDIYEEMKTIGAEIDHWCSDLYVKSTPEVDKIIEAYQWRCNCGKFQSQIAGDGIWWDIPFGYNPYWSERILVTPTKEA